MICTGTSIMDMYDAVTEKILCTRFLLKMVNLCLLLQTVCNVEQCIMISHTCTVVIQTLY